MAPCNMASINNNIANINNNMASINNDIANINNYMASINNNMAPCDIFPYLSVKILGHTLHDERFY